MTCRFASARLCQAQEFRTPEFTDVLDRLHLGRRLHRKYWEFVSLVRALEEAPHDASRPGAHGIGFGVGTEPLTSYFAARGCDVLATDLIEAGPAWGVQNAQDLSDTFNPSVCTRGAFIERVQFRSVDMRRIPEDLMQGQFDFLWSSSSLEHLGSAAAGEQFIRDSMRCLRPGGVAAHTTEYNVAHNVRMAHPTSIAVYCRSDIERLFEELSGGWTCDWRLGDEAADIFIDRHPYESDYHIKLTVNGVVITSVLLVLVR